jgi:hypothetical protein
MDLWVNNMDSIWYVVSFILVFVGILGSFLPVIPGPFVSWIGLLILQLATPIAENYYMLGITLILSLSLIIADYIIPYLSSKKYGGSRYGGIGASTGLVFGIFIPVPFSILICAFVGAFTGEMIYKSNFQIAYKAAIGSFIGVIATDLLKFLISIGFLIIMIYQVVTF